MAAGITAMLLRTFRTPVCILNLLINNSISITSLKRANILREQPVNLFVYHGRNEVYMKKIIAATVIISTLLMITSCASSEDNTPELVSGGQTTVAATDNTTAQQADKAEDRYFITYNGVDIFLGAEVAPVVKAIGKQYVYTENPSCAYVGIDYTYDYKSIIIYGQTKDGKEYITTVEVNDDSVDCGGIKIGQTLDDVKKVFGEPTSNGENGIIYDKNGTELQFITSGSDKITFILYTNANAE